MDSDDLDAVIVATPDDCHHEMTDVAEQKGVVNMINFTWRWMPFYTYIRELLAEGTIGELFYLNIAYSSSHGIEHQGWRFDADRAAGVLGDLGSHVDTYRHAFGGRCHRCFG